MFVVVRGCLCKYVFVVVPRVARSGNRQADAQKRPQGCEMGPGGQGLATLANFSRRVSKSGNDCGVWVYGVGHVICVGVWVVEVR